jgi:hypothetical protein
MVSAGAILIVAPIVGLYRLLMAFSSLLLSEQEYENLSESSLRLIDNRERWVGVVFNILPYIFIILIIMYEQIKT